uniref:NADH-ubiquinone oxidoreductase chain 4L n=1 Tax=Phascolosoma pacificum TaxID=1634976 RepID=A0A1D8BES4_9ANNE|nr:NADH dehydrogenase subunit 4L [Phascolosoma pacificum]AOS53043.1 NADH dehydrogenase subunit 4L [Phascolosoma pacificum]
MFFSFSLYLLIFPFTTISAFLLQRKQFLMTLLLLEALALALLINAFFSTLSTLFLALIILPMAGCEASLGLSLLVIMARQFGSDMLSNLTMNKW